MAKKAGRTRFTTMLRRTFILAIVRYCLYASVLLLGACSAQSGAKEALSSVKPDSINEKSVATKVEQDLWRYIVNRSNLKAPDDKHLYWHIDWFKKHPDYLTRITKRAQPYLYLVTQEVERAGLPLEIALLPIVESAYYPFSYSHGTASGLWQFIPSTGKLYGLKDSWWYDARRDVLASTKAAVKYLKNLKKLFKGDMLLAIAAYNSGPGRVQKAIRANKSQGKPTDFWHLELPKETRGYVPRLLAVTELIKHPEKYTQTITPVANQPALSSIKLNTQFDLALIAQWAELELEQLYTLNPGLKRWATPSSNHYTLLLPINNMGLFKQALENNPTMDRLKWVRHQVKQGDSLSQIAQQYRTTIEQITNVNKLDNHLIKVGEHLIVPIAQQQTADYVLSESEREKDRLSKRSARQVIHQVKSGDSLWGIANKYKVSVNNLIKWNHLKDVKTLPVGKRLTIWQKKSTPVKDLSSVVQQGLNIDRKVIYRVKSGDNLSVIANKFNVSVSQLKSWNQLGNKPLQPGQKLTIMVNVINTKLR